MCRMNKGDRIVDVPLEAERGMSAVALANRVQRLSARVGVDLGRLHNLPLDYYDPHREEPADSR